MHSPTIRLIYLGTFFISLRFFAAIQVIYFARVTGSYTLAMSLFAASTITQACAELPTGVLSDTLGRSRTALLSTLAALSSVTLYALGTGYWFLLAGAVVEGLGRALGSGNSEALLYDALRDGGEEGRYHHAIGRARAIEAAGFGLAALLGGVIASHSIGLALWLSVLTQAIAVAITLRIIEPASASRSTLNPYRHLRGAVGEGRDGQEDGRPRAGHAVGQEHQGAVAQEAPDERPERPETVDNRPAGIETHGA